MREFEYVIDEELKNGLNPFDSIPIGSKVLEECLGFRCGKLGLEEYVPMINPLPGAFSINYSWPFPQFLQGEKYNILVIRDSSVNLEDKVYSISDDFSTINHIFDIDKLTFGLGELMEIADFGKYAFMTNGVIMIYWDVGINDWHEVIASPTIPMMKTVCNFKGQTVGGNVVSDWYDCDDRYYVWSRIGEIDFTPDLRNTEGYRRCPYGGIVRHVRRLGNKVIGYSSKGITALIPVNEPAVTFGFVELLDIGIINKGAMNGNLSRQIFVGEDFRLYEVTDAGVKELGYKNYIEELAGEDIIVSYEPFKKDFYIGNSSKTFLLSPNGMTEIMQHPSAIGRGLMLPEELDDNEGLIVTEGFNMGYGGTKTVFSIETDLSPVNDLKGAVDYYNDAISNGTTNFVDINKEGIVFIIVSGSYFKVRLKFQPTYNKATVSYIKARYKMTDLKGIRGVYAPPLRGQ